MSKEMSKVDQARALREAKFAKRAPSALEPKKPARTELQREIDEMISPKAPPAEVKPAKPASNVATKNKKRVAEAIGKGRQASREGKDALTIYIPSDLRVQVKVVAAQQKTTVEEWVTTAIEMRLGVK